MPSKRKARVKARKAAKENASEAKRSVTKPCNSQNGPFDHFQLPANCATADLRECDGILWSDLAFKVIAGKHNWETKFDLLIDNIYPKYRTCSAQVKAVVRVLF
jgi:hypothetical protein